MAPCIGSVSSAAYQPLVDSLGEEAAPRARELVLEMACPQAVEGTMPLRRWPTDRQDDSHVDVVQFVSPKLFVHSNEEKLQVHVMRIGEHKGTCTVEYHTEEGSARAGHHFVHCTGRLEFEEGQSHVMFEVGIIDDPLWNPTLEFKISLRNPEGCVVGRYLQTTHVLAIDNTTFPSAKYSDAIKQGEAGIEAISKIGLYFEFWKLCFGMDGIAWRTCLSVLTYQICNLNLLVRLYVTMYMVDTVFNMHDETEENLLVPGDRGLTAVIVGAVLFVPVLFTQFSQDQIISMDIQGLVTLHLRRALLRRFLNYSAESRAKVPPADMQSNADGAVAEVAEGYGAMIAILAALGRMSILTFFVLRKNPAAWWAVVAMPLIMLVFAVCRTSIVMQCADASGDQETSLLETMSDAFDNFELISDYHQRPPINDLFSKKAEAFRAVQVPQRRVENTNSHFPILLGRGFQFLYLIIASRLVFEGKISLGLFLATLSVFVDIADNFSGVFDGMLAIVRTFPTLEGLTLYYNLETELPQCKQITLERIQKTVAAWGALRGNPSDSEGPFVPAADKVMIELRDVQFQHKTPDEAGEVGKPLFRKEGLTCSIKQGSVVAVVAPHGTGRTTCMHLLAHKVFPTSGSIFVPSYLRILNVSRHQALLQISFWANLTLGNLDGADPIRVTKILNRLKLERVLPLCAKSMQKVKEGARSETFDAEPDDRGMEAYRALSATEKAKLHIARAFIMNAEVTIFHGVFRHFDTAQVISDLWDMIKEHVVNRGIYMPEASTHLRRPRTVFLDPPNGHILSQCDTVIELHDGDAVRSNLRQA